MNWNPREKSIIRMRGMLRGRVHEEYRDTFCAELKSGMAEGVAKTVRLSNMFNELIS